ncbi:MAG: hypothetical protein A2161_21490 [Candidatus Schekmanbacteria bacterium RBG_13_48_7]|uniref:SHSP domain-containing protein n=1 Tax=Candidatus Schekmanbacteria bacterium RBG_13_48_7 TaxID=1817878 RepID=A0A1F7RPX1_9BACT|nr:MAG: hypothetical protein A2161_21490 [Candidatus Schekmanbacteria bacterium RBG_13_48_7]
MIMALVPWKNIGGEITRLQKEMNTLFDKYFRGEEDISRSGDWIPALDLAETDKEFVVTAEIPDIDPKNIDITVSGDRLIIKGEKKKETEEKDAHFHKIERSYGSFARQITLPAPIQEEKISADYDKGVLRVTIPKSEKIKTKSVKVNVKK